MGIIKSIIKASSEPSGFEIAKQRCLAELDRQQGKRLQIIGWQRQLHPSVLTRFNDQQASRGIPLDDMDHEDHGDHPAHEVGPVYAWI